MTHWHWPQYFMIIYTIMCAVIVPLGNGSTNGEKSIAIAASLGVAFVLWCGGFWG